MKKIRIAVGIGFGCFIIFVLIFGFTVLFDNDTTREITYVPPATGVDFTGKWTGIASVSKSFVSQPSLDLQYCQYEADIVLDLVQNVNEVTGQATFTNERMPHNCPEKFSELMQIKIIAQASNSEFHSYLVGGFPIGTALGNDGVLRGKFESTTNPSAEGVREITFDVRR